MIDIYKNKWPAGVIAIQYDGNNIKEVEKFVGHKFKKYYSKTDEYNYLKATLNSKNLIINIDDYISKDINNNFEVWNPQVFEHIYNIVEHKINI